MLVKPSLVVLGVRLDSVGSTEESIQFRIAEARRHFFARESVLCKRSVPLVLRWRRLQQTVSKTFLHGDGGWRLTHRLEELIVSFENSLLRRTLSIFARADEDPADFCHRVNSRLKFFKESFGYVSLVDTVKSYYFGWCGHAARLSEESPLRKLLHWRPDPEIRLLAPHGREVRARRGPPLCFDEAVVEYIGLNWKSYAANRAQWGSLARQALSSWGARFSHVPSILRRFCVSQVVANARGASH